MNLPLFNASGFSAGKGTNPVSRMLTRVLGACPAEVNEAAADGTVDNAVPAESNLSRPLSKGIGNSNVALVELETLDSELVVAVFRIVLLLIAFLVPHIFGTAHTTLEELQLAGLASIYALVAALACLYPRRYGVRRPFLVAVDVLLITLWMRLSQQWELFSLYYIVVIVAAMWFRVLGGALVAIFCDFFFLFLWVRAAGDHPDYPVVFRSAYALNLALLLLAGCLAGYIAEAQERERLSRMEGQILVANYQREIDLANQMQPILMEGGGYREWDTLRLGLAQKSARSFGGGDYFDVLKLADGRTALYIADVSGKSVRAQARLPLLKYSLRALAPLYAEPGALLTRLNQTIAPELENDLFIGLCMVLIDVRERTLTWCNAGHCAPLLLKDKTALELETCGPALGPFPDIPYTTRQMPYGVNDRLLMYTDGLSDALSFAGTEDGEGQVKATVCALEDPAWQLPQGVAQLLLDMATAVLDETASPWLARLPERIAREKLPLDKAESPSSVRRDDITVAVVTFGEDAPAAQPAAASQISKSTEA